MRRLVDVVIILAIVGAAVTYGPSIVDKLSEDAGHSPDELVTPDEPDRAGERDRREAERLQEDAKRGVLEAQADAIEQQIEALEQSERECYAAAKRPGGTAGRCDMYQERIREAEERLRALERQ